MFVKFLTSITYIQLCYNKNVINHRPREMSSKRPVSRFREVVPVAKDGQRVVRDPRFEETAGQLNTDLFKKSYAFVDELKRKEKQLIEREVHKTRSAGKKAQLQKLLLQMVRLLVCGWLTVIHVSGAALYYSAG